MPFEKGKSGNPKGRKKGDMNKDVRLAREAIANLVENSVPQMQSWLDEIREEHGPLAAWKCISDVMEYHLPKLARTEHTGQDGGDINISLNKIIHADRDT